MDSQESRDRSNGYLVDESLIVTPQSRAASLKYHRNQSARGVQDGNDIAGKLRLVMGVHSMKHDFEMKRFVRRV